MDVDISQEQHPTSASSPATSSLQGQTRTGGRKDRSQGIGVGRSLTQEMGAQSSCPRLSSRRSNDLETDPLPSTGSDPTNSRSDGRLARHNPAGGIVDSGSPQGKGVGSVGTEAWTPQRTREMLTPAQPGQLADAQWR